LLLVLYTYIYICVCVCMYVCMYYLNAWNPSVNRLTASFIYIVFAFDTVSVTMQIKCTTWRMSSQNN